MEYLLLGFELTRRASLSRSLRLSIDVINVLGRRCLVRLRLEEEVRRRGGSKIATHDVLTTGCETPEHAARWPRAPAPRPTRNGEAPTRRRIPGFALGEIGIRPRFPSGCFVGGLE